MKYKGLIIALAIVFVVIVIPILYGVSKYNGFVTQNEDINGKWAQVETQYQRRTDLIPNLVNTVKGYANFEQKTLTDVIEARSKVAQMNVTKEVLDNPAAFQKFQQSQSQLSGSLSRLMLVVEKYPDLKANENFKSLMTQLEGTENRISVARGDFNIVVQAYNVTIKKFPSVIFAGIFGFREKQYFQAEQGAEKAPKVDFNAPAAK